MKRIGTILRMGLIVGAVAARAAADVAVGAADFRRDLEALTSGPQRLAGREDGSRAASRYVEGRLRAMGVTELYVQEFPVQQPRMRECALESGGERYPLFAMRPNLLQASVTPAAGLSGETVYLGRGTLADFSAQALKGRLAVMDFDCGEEWLKAFAYGAQAVLFVEQPGRPAQPLHHVRVPANLPRFYVPVDVAAKLALTNAPRQVCVRAACEWEALRGRSVIGVIRGRPASGGQGPREAIMLAAPLDAYSEVPDLSAGASEAAQAAALLHLAQRLCQVRPGRDVVLAFFDGQSLGHAGARVFYGSLYRRMGVRKLADRTLEELPPAAQQEQRYFNEFVKGQGLSR